MEQNQFIQLGEQGRTILVSGKLFNNDGGLILPPKAGFWRFLDFVMLPLWSAGPRRETCLASKRQNLVKRFRMVETCSQ